MRAAMRTLHWFGVPVLTKRRIWFAFIVAVVTDAVQIGLGPFGWLFMDQILDVIAMVLTSAALGFHLLLLPTFVIEMLPVTDLLPTWIACVATVVMLRKKAAAMPPPPPAPHIPPQLEQNSRVDTPEE